MAIAAAVTLAGCGSARHPERAKLAHYITAVQAIEMQMKAPLAVVSAVGHDISGLGTSSTSATLRRRLAAAHATLVRLRRRLAALPAPAGAGTLRAELSARAADQARLTHELWQMIGYPSRFAAAIRPLSAAVHNLQHALAQSTSTSLTTIDSARAQALLAFRHTVIGIEDRLRRLPVPAVYRPGYAAEQHALAQMSLSADALARALRAGGAGAAAPLASLQRAFSLGTSTSVRRAEIAAITTYDRQLQQLNVLAVRIQVERRRLSATVG